MPSRVLDYGRLVMGQEMVAGHEAARRMADRMARPHQGAGTEEMRCWELHATTTTALWLPSGVAWGPGPRADWPTRVMDWPLLVDNELVFAARLSDPVGGAGRPLFDRADAAIYELIYGTPLERPGLRQVESKVLLRIADRRARIGIVEARGTLLHVSVELGPEAPTDLVTAQVTWKDETGRQRSAELTVAETGQLVFETGAASSDWYVAIVDGAGDWLDERRCDVPQAHPSIASPWPVNVPPEQAESAPLGDLESNTRYDVFVSHASEDKETFVRPLARGLRDGGLAVWFDEFELRPGQSLRRSLDQGLARSRFGVVVLSPAFLGKKKWTEFELDGMVQLFDQGNLVPVWHDVSHDEVMSYSASLADKVAISSEKGFGHVVDGLLRIIRPEVATPVPGPHRLSRTESAGSIDPGAQQRAAINALRASVVRLQRHPPDLPMCVTGRSLTDWEPVVGPLMNHFGATVELVAQTAAGLQLDLLRRLARGIRDLFAEHVPIGGTSWLTDAPRLMCRLVSDQVLVQSYALGAWDRFAVIGDPAFVSRNGRMPWVLSNEYRHPGTLGDHADTACELVLSRITPALSEPAGGGFTAEDVERALAAVNVGFVLGYMARMAENGAAGIPYTWGLTRSPFWRELSNWEEDELILDTFAAWGGEPKDVFRRLLHERVLLLLGTLRRAGYVGYIPDEAGATLARISGSPP